MEYYLKRYMLDSFVIYIIIDRLSIVNNVSVAIVVRCNEELISHANFVGD